RRRRIYRLSLHRRLEPRLTNRRRAAARRLPSSGAAAGPARLADLPALAPDIRSYKIHAGGITALGEQGYRHYLPLALLHLCGSRATISCHGYRA
ncbi:hypothetical protein, partial [Rhizobium sullae]|uniref:hypothetical protein n=1 Tax=Rhizobium sullae TaxID=50338 RepID=UPI001AECE038